MQDQRDLLFKESQRFTQWWLWILLFGIFALPIYGIVQQLIFKEPWGSKPMPDIGLMIFALVMAALVYFIYYIKLMTWIHPDRIVLSFPPFFKRKQFLFADIESAKVVTYGILVGYGLRFSPKYGTVYNIKGNKGLAITMKNGGKYMIGTQHPAQVEELVKHLLSHM
ncbi:hypothetical protein [Lentiprolixibacter aurantiacus]|uniref:Uncharacterized protein n=1 Tax=Lentiprolixibacter aurantiacus TaxID=2993939 RepID=A0AAE3SQ99_9FLAO|nr:hypothetical protein [Lentiprolixibacter aurantiacus]MCX2720302.1 hypothetical protein [Lentiprolixibacter aurantiacus]